MNRDRVVTQESFDALLTWLDCDREQSGRKYEQVRLRLIKIFACRGCHEPEDLADETINRVIGKLAEIKDSFQGDPALYFYGVANNVHREYLRRQRPPVQPPPQPDKDTETIEREYGCLEKCVEKLTPANQRLVLQYYQQEKRAKIEHRKQLAAEFGIALNALRIRAHRIRGTLQQCVHTCLQEATA